MHIPDSARFYLVGREDNVASDPLEVVFADADQHIPRAPEPPAPDVIRTNLDYFAGGWNAAFHLGGGRDAAEFGKYISVIKELKNPNVVIAPRVHGYSELHGLLASLCPDDVLAKYRLPRHSTNFLLCPVSVESGGDGRHGVSPSVLTARAETCCAAFRDFVWSRVVQRGRRRFKKADFDPRSSIRVLFDDSPFWMNAVYRMALRRAREHLSGELTPILPIEFMNNWRIHDLYGGLAGSLPALGPGEVLEVRQNDGRVVYRRCRTVPKTGAKHQFSAPPGSAVVYGFKMGDDLKSLSESTKQEEGLSFEPIDGEFTDSKLRVKPVLKGGDLWDPADPKARERAFDEMLGSREMASIEPVVGVLTGEALLEDLPDRRWSYLKEDVLRRLHMKPRKGRERIRVEVRETVDDHPVIDESALLVDGEAVLRSVMVTLDPRERRIIVLLRSGRTRNEIAAEVGYKNHSGLSRMISKLEMRIRRALGLDPTVSPREKRAKPSES